MYLNQPLIKFSFISEMAPPQTLTGFGDESQIDFFKCCLLFERLEIEREKYPGNPSLAHTKDRISRLKRSLDVSQFENFRNELDINTAEDFARGKSLRIRIWKQVDRSLG